MYLPHGLYTLKDSRLVVDVDASFNDALDYIRSVCFENLGLVEVFLLQELLSEKQMIHSIFIPKSEMALHR